MIQTPRFDAVFRLKRIINLFLVCVFIFCVGCHCREKLYSVSPSIVSGTVRDMKSPGFWIHRHPFADRVILDPEQIYFLNKHIRENLNLTRKVTGVNPVYCGQELFKDLESHLNLFRATPHYDQSCRLKDKAFYAEIEKNMRLQEISSEVQVAFGLVNRYADQRLLPFSHPLYKEPGDIHFDQVQNSSLHLGVPLAVLHESKDGKWVYALSSLSDGWIERSKVSLFSLEDLKDYFLRKDFCVVTAARADIFLDPDMTVYHDFVRMGSRFPLGERSDPSVAEIMIPFDSHNGQSTWRKAYVSAQKVHQGYLTYTPRVIIEQAFKFLDASYGWGGMHGEQDCSGFLKEVFAAVGIILPRNSSAQALVGAHRGHFEKGADQEKKRALLQRAVGGVTLLRLDGHIMLFLGTIDNAPYVIHLTWGARERWGFKEHTRVFGRVVVTGLELGQGTRRGSLLERILSISDVSFIPLDDEQAIAEKEDSKMIFNKNHRRSVIHEKLY